MAIAATANHAMTNGPAFAHMMDSAASRRESGAPQTQPQHQNQQQPVGEMTINLLADDNHTDLWRQPMGLNGHGILQTGKMLTTHPSTTGSLFDCHCQHRRT